MGYLKNKFVSWLLKGVDIDYKTKYVELLDTTDKLIKTHQERSAAQEKITEAYKEAYNSLDKHYDDMSGYAKEAVTRLELLQRQYDQMVDMHNTVIKDYNDLLDSTKELADKYNTIVYKNNAAVDTLKNVAGAYGLSDSFNSVTNRWTAGWLTITEALFDVIASNDYIIGDFFGDHDPNTLIFKDTKNPQVYFIRRNALVRIVKTFLTMRGKERMWVPKEFDLVNLLVKYNVIETGYADGKPEYTAVLEKYEKEFYIVVDIYKLEDLIKKYGTDLSKRD